VGADIAGRSTSRDCKSFLLILGEAEEEGFEIHEPVLPKR